VGDVHIKYNYLKKSAKFKHSFKLLTVGDKEANLMQCINCNREKTRFYTRAQPSSVANVNLKYVDYDYLPEVAHERAERW
jgi:hypothetical protein